MFTKVHHVTYIVESVQQMADYLESNFGLRPAKRGENPDRKFILYHIGPTIMDFFEPTTEDSGIARQLREHGPGVAHVAWGVEGIDQVFQGLKSKGSELRGDAPSTSPFGYKTLNIEPSSSHGILFQLAEGEESQEVTKRAGLWSHMRLEQRPKNGWSDILEINPLSTPCFEGQRIRAWYTVPTGQPPTRGWPAIMEVPGYGGIMPLPVHLVQYGYATLSLYPRSQGESLKEWEIEHGTRIVYNITDRDRYYYRSAYMDCVRGIDFLCSRSEIDTGRIGVWGFSQGGGLSLATAALDHRVAAAVAGVPWLCNFSVAAEITTSPYVELHDYLEEHPEERDTALATLAYFDQLNLAEGIVCPTLIASAIIDEVHPLRTVMPVFEKIAAMKSIIVYPDLEHEYRSDFTSHGKAWMDRYLH